MGRRRRVHGRGARRAGDDGAPAARAGARFCDCGLPEILRVEQRRHAGALRRAVAEEASRHGTWEELVKSLLVKSFSIFCLRVGGACRQRFEALFKFCLTPQRPNAGVGCPIELTPRRVATAIVATAATIDAAGRKPSAPAQARC